MLGRGNDHGVDILKREHILQLLKRAWLAAIILYVLGDSFLAVDAPQIAQSGHFHVMTVLKLGYDPVQLLAATSGPDVA